MIFKYLTSHYIYPRKSSLEDGQILLIHMHKSCIFNRVLAQKYEFLRRENFDVTNTYNFFYANRKPQPFWSKNWWSSGGKCLIATKPSTSPLRPSSLLECCHQTETCRYWNEENQRWKGKCQAKNKGVSQHDWIGTSIPKPWREGPKVDIVCLWSLEIECQNKIEWSQGDAREST